MIFVFHVTLKYHAIKALNGLMVSSPSRFVTILSSLVVIDHVVVERYNSFNLTRDLARPHDQKIV